MNEDCIFVFLFQTKFKCQNQMLLSLEEERSFHHFKVNVKGRRNETYFTRGERELFIGLWKCQRSGKLIIQNVSHNPKKKIDVTVQFPKMPKICKSMMRFYNVRHTN